LSTQASLWRPVFLTLVTLALVSPARSGWAADDQKHVLLLHSARRDSVLAETGDREFSRLLDAALNGQLDYFPEYVDTARFPDPKYRTAFRDFLRLKYKAQQFHLLVALENTSLDFAREIRDDLAPGAPIVFSSSRRDVQRIPNSTGIIDEPDFSRTVRLVLQLQPETTQVFVVTGSSSRDKFYESVARARFRSYESLVEFNYLSGMPASDLEARVASLPERSVVFYAMVSQDGEGENFLPIEYLDRLAKASNRPIYSWVEAAMDHGIVGGSLMQPDVAMAAIADLALRVLQGERADDIPTTTPERTFNQLDWRQLRRWNIAESRVPAGTFVRFREQTIWDLYQPYILGGAILLVAQTALIAGLLVQGARRRKAEAMARASQAELRTSYDRIRDLGGRLLTAQESERSRIARELHDDISQQVALLSMDLELLNASSRSQPPADVEDLRETLDRVQRLAKSVHDLSHRLHPAKLRLVGLVGALSSLPRELAQPGTAVTFTHANVPDGLPHDVTLCLFRVAQEAVQNAIKHGVAPNVAVHLGADNHALFLTILDDGKGFDVRGDWGKGLGLISMSERLELIGGTVQFHSSPGAGTRVEVSLPFPAAEARADSA
jgi:signal transduction histidine kinase